MAWLFAAMLLLAGPLVFWNRLDPHDLDHQPETPLDRTHTQFASQWRFLDHARGVVPPGENFTVWAPAPDDEMAMFMMALALYPDEVPIPSSYWSQSKSQYGGAARFILSLDCDPRNEKSLAILERVDQGCVFRRPLAP